jgi:hypothetical protein
MATVLLAPAEIQIFAWFSQQMGTASVALRKDN